MYIGLFLECLREPLYSWWMSSGKCSQISLSGLLVLCWHSVLLCAYWVLIFSFFVMATCVSSSCCFSLSKSSSWLKECPLNTHSINHPSSYHIVGMCYLSLEGSLETCITFLVQQCRLCGLFCAIKEIQIPEPDSKEQIKKLSSVLVVHFSWLSSRCLMSITVFVSLVWWTDQLDFFLYWQEVNFLSQFSHPNIVQYYGSNLVSSIS